MKRRQHAPEIQASGIGNLLTCIPTIDDVLNDYATALREDFSGYRNHVYRIVNLCVAMAGRSELEKIAVAAVFHDLGIWVDTAAGSEFVDDRIRLRE